VSLQKPVWEALEASGWLTLSKEAQATLQIVCGESGTLVYCLASLGKSECPIS